MKHAPILKVEPFRILGEPNTPFGAFCVPAGEALRSTTLNVIASVGLGWDHVSVSLAHRVPYWREMEHVKRLFFREDEWAMQLHAPAKNHISFHPFTLHLWRPQPQSEIDFYQSKWPEEMQATLANPIPIPPRIFV